MSDDPGGVTGAPVDESTDPAAPDEPDRIAVGDLRVVVDVDATVDGEPLRIRSRDGRVEVHADRLAALRSFAGLRAALPLPPDAPVDRVPLGLYVRGVEVARVDPGVSPGPVARALGVAPARVDLVGVVRALAGRRRRD